MENASIFSKNPPRQAPLVRPAPVEGGGWHGVAVTGGGWTSKIVIPPRFPRHSEGHRPERIPSNAVRILAVPERESTHAAGERVKTPLSLRDISPCRGDAPPNAPHSSRQACRATFPPRGEGFPAPSNAVRKASPFGRGRLSPQVTDGGWLPISPQTQSNPLRGVLILSQ